MNERNHRMNHNAISMVQLLAATLLCLNLAEGAGNGAMLRSPTMTVRFEQTTPKFYIFAGSMTEVPSKYFLGQFSEIGEYNGDNGVTGRYFSRLVDDTWTFGPVTEVAAGLTTINITRTLSVASTPVTFRVEASMYKNETTITSGGSRMAIPQDSLRLQLHVSNWPFASTSNTLRIYMRFTDLYYDNPDIRVAKLNGNLAVLSLPGDTMSANIAFAAKSSINNTSQVRLYCSLFSCVNTEAACYDIHRRW